MSVVGIDLGTTNTVVAAVRAGKVHVLADEKGARLLPSVVSFHPNGDVLVGAAAKARRVIDARNTVYSHKRLIGRSWGSPEIAQAKQRFPFELKEGPGQGPLVHARNQDYSLPEISAFVLKRSKQIAEAALGQPVERAVITVPAHFNELQRASTKVAGRVSGLEVLRILNEPTAAALAYGLGRSGSERVAVYDFGGGTFDCTLLDLNGNVFEVLATAGDSFLGGDDVDQIIADRMAEAYLKMYRNDVRSDPQAYERLKTTAEEMKIVLSTADTHTVVLKELGHGMGGSSINLTFTMTRRDLEAAMTTLVDRTFKVTQDALTLARLSPTSFDKVILVGGSTRAPMVRKRVEAFFGSQPMDRVNPDEVVAIGAAIQAAALTEGQRRRSIPAPPPGPMAFRKLEKEEFTQTSELDPSMLKPAFSSEPPAFGFASTVGSVPPQTAQMQRGGTAGSVPPMRGAMPTGPGSPLKRTNPGLAPAPPPAGSQAFEDDPSLQSLPDLQAPAPFEWVPTPTGIEDPQTLTQQAPLPGGPPLGDAPSPFASHVPNYNRIDEPPSVFATSTGGRIPKFRGPAPSSPSNPPPSSRSAPPPSSRRVPTAPSAPPAAPPPPLPDDSPFGALADLSLVSTSGVSSAQTNPGFGHVSDLSLISTTGQSETGVSLDAAARLLAMEGEIADGEQTDAFQRLSPEARAKLDAPPMTMKGVAPAFAPAKGPGSTVQLEPGENPAAKKEDSLIDREDLPAVVARAKPARKPGQQTVPSMGMKAPPLIAPQPFGPMEKMDEAPASQRPASQGNPRTVNMPSPANSPAPRPQIAKRSEGKIPNAPPSAPGSMAPPATQAMPQAMPPRHPPPAVPGVVRPGPPPAPPRPSFPEAQLPESGSFETTQQAPAPQPPPPRAPFAMPPEPFAAPPPKPFSAPPPPQPFSAPPPQHFSAPPQQFQPPPQQFQPPPQQFQPPPQQFQPPPQQFQPPPQQFQPPPPQQFQPPQRQPSYQPPPQQLQQPPPNNPFAFGSAPPEAMRQPSNSFGGFGSVPPSNMPPPNQQPSQQPPGMFGGSFNSAPPQDAAIPLDYSGHGGFNAPPDAQNIPPHGAPPEISYSSPVLVDVTPRGLVVETAGGYTDIIIPRNSKIPCERTRRFATGRDMQTSVRVRVAQGEETMFAGNTFLGEVDLSGLRPANRGEVTVAVTFEVDADGTLKIRARDTQTGQEARATLQLIGVADESSVVMMINRFAGQQVVGQTH